MPDEPDNSSRAAAAQGAAGPGDDAPRFAYPVFVDLHDVPVLVVGGGPVGARKAAGLAAAGARVRMVAAVVSDAVDRSCVHEVRERPFENRDLDGVRLVVAATGTESTDREIAVAANAAGVWVNAADQPADCEFILPAITRAGFVSVAVSSDGRSPAIAQYVRDLIAPLLDDDVLAVAEDVARHRRELQAAGESTEGRDWRREIEDLMAQRRASG